MTEFEAKGSMVEENKRERACYNCKTQKYCTAFHVMFDCLTKIKIMFTNDCETEACRNITKAFAEDCQHFSTTDKQEGTS